MSRLAWLSIAVALGAAACGTGSVEQSEQPSAQVADAAPVIGASTPTSLPNGIAIPNVSLTLADGSPLDLADVETPMLMIFWAEW